VSSEAGAIHSEKAWILKLVFIRIALIAQQNILPLFDKRFSL
jgi:hypothetical protein